MVLNKICLENELISTAVSTFGGKILSMYNKKNRSEWLFQSALQEISPASDGTFTKDVAFGCDEMFPTIIPETSRLPDGTPVDLPDHGELWNREWEVLSQHSDSLEMQCEGQVLPILFERRILLSGRSLICRYRVSNHSKEDIPALWTPHPLFSFHPETEIVLPEECRSITQAGSDGGLGPYLNRTQWGPKGWIDGIGHLLLPDSLMEGSAYKFYCTNPVSEGQVIFKDQRGMLIMNYPAPILPWLGLWINKGGFGGDYNLAPEPATAPFDSPSRAEAYGVSAVWKGNEVREWELAYSLNC